MANENEKYDGKDGFKYGPGGTGVYPDTTYYSDDPNDYLGWDWKQLEASVISSASGPPIADYAIADPDSTRVSAVWTSLRAAVKAGVVSLVGEAVLPRRPLQLIRIVSRADGP